ncbi:DUF3450 domain-containing protein [Flocculibacter collagenilyticus]|uniref:DUF3450 domain-containing protein n=1 Tax=Flocculibacter collagenilyticus TaxID=2744479 RepID=UPI0018F54FDA|nr:DUF3450 domain-containing protein [Flocculibacter collagenilyticus]
MSVRIRKSLVATALVGAFALVGGNAVADPLNELHKAEIKIHKAAAKSQSKINGIYEQTQEIVAEYRAVVDEMENLKVYNDHVARLVADQQSEIDSLNSQITEIETTKKTVIPMMYKMIDTLEEFVEADIPILQEERASRIELLRETMSRAKVTTSEKYRQVLEAYQIEKDYGSMLRAWQGTLNYEGTDITVDFVHYGRVAFVAQSLDQKNSWVWNNNSRSWEKLDEEYNRSVTQAIKVARKQAAATLIKLPILAAE